jgi:hypothetical protein
MVISNELLELSAMNLVQIKGKAIPATGRRGPLGYVTSKLPHFQDNQLTDGGEVVSLTRPPAFTPRKIPGTQFS